MNISITYSFSISPYNYTSTIVGYPHFKSLLIQVPLSGKQSRIYRGLNSWRPLVRLYFRPLSKETWRRTRSRRSFRSEHLGWCNHVPSWHPFIRVDSRERAIRHHPRSWDIFLWTGDDDCLHDSDDISR